MNPQNITPNTNPATLQNTMQTQPSAVVTSDLATNITNKNLETLAQEEQKTQQRIETQKAIRMQKEQDQKKQELNPVDKQITDMLGGNNEPVDPIKVQREKDLNNIRAKIDNISQQVDPLTAEVLNNIYNLVETSQ